MADLFDKQTSKIPRLLSCDEVGRAVGYSRVHIYRLMDRGEFPKRVQIGRNRVGWLESEVAEWLNARIEAR
ncbi:helix-turn-helix transcriptional regulator [Jannaschia pohangensis]|uniref:Transcriptional regulator, AlpA family n=1 Tax=Jannaschia pohangensis TaxID=390807 RepID=A0A1I3J1Z2_9RHOB|nr:AlpA family phage regulatory protein [Jannaschia pohangensis]SFI54076.1 transcriptional regulator, AlpA family [Jannaschia pohangensis]